MASVYKRLVWLYIGGPCPECGSDNVEREPLRARCAACGFLAQQKEPEPKEERGRN